MSTDAEALRAAMQTRHNAAIADIKAQLAAIAERDRQELAWYRANCSCWRQPMGEYPAL